MEKRIQSRLLLPHERDFFIARIKSGYIRLKYEGQTYKFQLNNDLIYEAEEVYSDTYERCVNDGGAREDELIAFLRGKDLWNDDEEERLTKKIPEYIENVKVEMYNTFHKPETVDRMRLYLNRAKEELFKIFEVKHQFDYLSCQGAALYARWQFLVQNGVTYLDGKKVDWIGNKSHNVLSLLNGSGISEESIRDVARNEPWATTWVCSERCGALFNRAVAEYTDDQNRLVTWSMMYENIRKQDDAPDRAVFDDDDCFDGWMILKNRKNKEDIDRERFERKLGKNGTAQEVFVPVKSLNSPDLHNDVVHLEDPALIFGLNTPLASSIINSRFNDMNRAGGKEVRVNDLTDVRTNLMMEATRLEMAVGK